MKISEIKIVKEAEDPALAKLKAAIAKMKELKPELATAPTQGGAATNANRTATTRSSSSVSGTIKMGKPEGPIQFNGKTVNPGDPDYKAASDALMAQHQRMQQARQGNRNRVRQPATGQARPTAPAQQRTANRNIDDF